MVDDGAASGLEEMGRELFRATVELQPALVVIDSSKALNGLVPENACDATSTSRRAGVGQTDTVLGLQAEP